MELILANSALNDICVLQGIDADFEIGEEDNTFEIVVSQSDLRSELAPGAYVYIQDTELGGKIGELEINTEDDTYKYLGLTWRGYLQKRIISPPSGQDYRKVSGELNSVIGTILGLYFPDFWVADSVSTGVSVANYQFERYCTVYDGLKAMLASKGYKLKIVFDGTNVIVSATEIRDLSNTIELSQDTQIDFKMLSVLNGVNHLICLGAGELHNRLVAHIYVQRDGTIGNTQYYFGMDEVVGKYENTSYDNASELKSAGAEVLAKLMNYSDISMDLASLDVDADVGDIVGGRDYATGISLKQPIVSKIWKLDGGLESYEYKIGGTN